LRFSDAKVTRHLFPPIVVAHFPISPDSSASILPAGALAGLGMANENVAGNEIAARARSIQKQWFVREVLPHETGLRVWIARQHPVLKAELDDVVQESYLRLLRAHAAGTIQCARTYLFGIARYVALELHRKRRTRCETSVNELRESDTIAADDDIVAMITHSQELALTAEAIKQLPDRCRQIVVLHTIDGLSYQHIAAKLGLAEETVRVQMARAVKKCIAYLRERNGIAREGL
jgi:RNA polymerase sigma factor (sigma-70 family)